MQRCPTHCAMLAMMLATAMLVAQSQPLRMMLQKQLHDHRQVPTP
jgi:hypothetical protein